MLANAYLEWDVTAYWQKALNAVGLANSVSATCKNKYNTFVCVCVCVHARMYIHISIYLSVCLCMHVCGGD